MFILVGFDSKENLNPLHIWIFYKDNILRGEKFWKRDHMVITNKPRYLYMLDYCELRDELKMLEELCSKELKSNYN